MCRPVIDDLGAARGLARAAVALRHVRTPLGAADGPRRAHRAFCEDVAAYFDQAPGRDPASKVTEHYRCHAEENLVQYRAARDAGIEVRPWTGPGQPYAGSRELIDSVRRTGVLHLFLTRDGHGPRGGTDHPVDHPLRAGSGVVEHGVELTHNDLLRVVHDLYGHVLHGTGFGVRGELAASYAHSRMYSDRARRVLFTEQVGQICWYFHGPHRRGEARDPERPYPVQKVFLYPTRYLTGLTRLFEE